MVRTRVGSLERLHTMTEPHSTGLCPGMRFAEALSTAKTLRRLSLDENRLDAEAALALAAGLALNRNLTCLTLGANAIGPVGVRALLKTVDAKARESLRARAFFHTLPGIRN